MIKIYLLRDIFLFSLIVFFLGCFFKSSIAVFILSDSIVVVVLIFEVLKLQIRKDWCWTD